MRDSNEYEFAEWERVALSEPTGFPPHPFVGRLDRWCAVCDRPDRNLIHGEQKDGR